MQPAPKATAADLQPGAEPIAGYRLVQRLGAGGFGEVWKAQAPGGFDIALKFVNVAAQGKPGKRQAGASELRALEIIKNIHHPNLLTTFGAWQTPQYLVIAMELADGSLWDRFCQAQEQELPGIPRPELLDYFEEAAKGIDYLNTARLHLPEGEAIGIQHRDIKPQNILLAGGGVKVADFGLARLLERSMTGHTGSMTVSYAAPEFFHGQTTRQSDQYSLAISYCQMRGGRLPFEGNMAQVTAGHLMCEPDLTMLPEEERPIVAGALAKNPPERWPSCREFVQALRAIALAGQGPGSRTVALPASRSLPARTLPTGADATTALPGSDDSRSGGRGQLAAIVTVLLISTLGVVGWKWYRSGGLTAGPFSRPATEAVRTSVPAGDAVVLKGAVELEIHPGETKLLGIRLVRNQYPGTLQICGHNLPTGISLKEQTIPSGGVNADVEVTALGKVREGVHEAQLILTLGADTLTQPLKITVLASPAKPQYQQAEQHRNNREFDDAIRAATEAIRLDPKHSPSYFLRGWCFGERGEHDKALADYFEVIRLDPANFTAFNNRGSAWVAKGDYDRAIADYTESLRIRPTYGLAYLGRGIAYYRKQEYDRTIADCTEALHYNAKDAKVFYFRGLAYLAKSEPDRALTDLSHAIELKADVAAYYSARATAYEKKGELAKAAADRKKAAALK